MPLISPLTPGNLNGLPSRYVVAIMAFGFCQQVVADDATFLDMTEGLHPNVVVKFGTFGDADGKITTVGIDLKTKDNAKRRRLLALLPELKQLEYLRSLGIGVTQDDDLKTLPPLPQLKLLGLSQEPITDAALPYLDGMSGLKYLNLAQTQVRGHGLIYLKDSANLESLDLHSTPLDDSAIPHIVTSFPKLRRFSFNHTNVTPQGLLQLAELHWLLTVGCPDDIVGPDESLAMDREERSRLIRERHEAKLRLFYEYNKRYHLARLKARAAGDKVPEDWRFPFSFPKEKTNVILETVTLPGVE